MEPDTIDALRIGQQYQTTYGTLWKDGTFFPRGTNVMVAGLHLEQGFCVRFPLEVEGEPLETWEDWAETDFSPRRARSRMAVRSIYRRRFSPKHAKCSTMLRTEPTCTCTRRTTSTGDDFMKTMDTQLDLSTAIPSTMMDVDLTITWIYEHVLRNHGTRHVVSRLDDGTTFRYTYADFGKRVAQLAHALIELGIKPGDRVASFAGIRTGISSSITRFR